MRATLSFWRSRAVLATTWVALASPLACGNSATAPRSADEQAVESTLRTSCEATAPTACSMPSPHYADIVPILQRSCTPCHNGETGSPWPLTGYDDVAAWSDAIQQDLSSCAMPPLDGGVPMTTADRLAVLDWVQCGDPQ